MTSTLTFAAVTPVDTPFNDWQWQVRRVEVDGGERLLYVAERVGIEGRRGWTWIGEYPSFERAEAAVERHRAQSIAAYEQYWRAQ